ncbi:MAG: DUF917 domain-containing protein [Thermomicrobiales bacterium]|nr:DUF917 domain-containing protein [Thermomicrobiales bacterium]
MWNVTEAALEALAIGAGILGTGGGGNPYIGKLEARQQLRMGRAIQVVSVDEVPDDALITGVGGMGAPIVSNERVHRGDEPLAAMRALERHLGRQFTHVIPGEIGGSNSMTPMVVAAQAGLPVIDGDGMGRAFPELQMDTFTIYGVTPTPGALADPRGHLAIFDKVSDPAAFERYARAVTIQMGGSTGYAFPPMTSEEVRRTTVRDTVTLAIALGEAVLRARAGHVNPVDAALRVTGGQRLFHGQIVDVERRLVGGFARGVLQLDGSGPDAGATLRIDFQNENLIARTGDGEILAVVPDLICIVDQDTAEPVTTEILRYGLRVVVVGIPAPAMLKTPEALPVIGPAAFGYPDVPFHPLPGVYGSGLAKRAAAV